PSCAFSSSGWGQSAGFFDPGKTCSWRTSHFVSSSVCSSVVTGGPNWLLSISSSGPPVLVRLEKVTAGGRSLAKRSGRALGGKLPPGSARSHHRRERATAERTSCRLRSLLL